MMCYTGNILYRWF